MTAAELVLENVIVARFTIAGEPVSKARPRFTRYGSKTHFYTPEKTLTAEKRMASAFLEVCPQKGTDVDAAFGVSAHFYSGTRQRRDVDNMLKLVLDGLNKIAWPDDVQVIEVDAAKSFVAPADARTEVTVYSAGRVYRLMKPCKHCGVAFETWPSHDGVTHFCSASCRTASRIAARQTVCEQCGETFLRHGPARESRFCSRACSNESRMVTTPCSQCGDPVKKRASSVGKDNYCTDACMAKASRARQKVNGGPGTCETCGLAVSRKEYHQCRACQRAAQAERKSAA